MMALGSTAGISSGLAVKILGDLKVAGKQHFNLLIMTVTTQMILQTSVLYFIGFIIKLFWT